MRFIYSGYIKSIQTHAYDLLAVADKYAIEGLKTMCGKYLPKNLSIDNVVNILALADLHSATQLRKDAIDFLFTHRNEFASSDEFESIKNLKPSVLKEIIHTIMLR